MKRYRILWKSSYRYSKLCSMDSKFIPVFYFDDPSYVQASFYGSYSNNWDNGTIGNYWSDYRGTDSNHDGIGDTPYVIDSNNKDNYPFMSPSLIPFTPQPTFPVLSPFPTPTPTSSSVPMPTPSSTATLPPTNIPTQIVSPNPTFNSPNPTSTQSSSSNSGVTGLGNTT